jgi:group I intron endonuclease
VTFPYSNIGIYMIRNVITGQYYIGSAQNLKRRFREHEQQLKAGAHFNSRLQNAWNKHGATAFVFFPLSMLQTKEQLIPAEQLMIDSYRAADCNFGYNSRPTAQSNLGHKFSDETRQKIRVANIGRKASAETRAKMSASAKGTPKGSEHARRISVAKTGVPRPDVKLWAPEKFSRFDKSVVLQIRRERACGSTYRAIAEKYGCSIATAHFAINGTGVHYASI